jgi:drug/metabolite transporter (DMT)-like permease
MRRGYVALGIGLAITGALVAAMYTTVTRGIPSGQEVIPIAAAYPILLYPGLPGIYLIVIAAATTGMNFAFHPIGTVALAMAGNAAFYSTAAYALLLLLPRRKR